MAIDMASTRAPACATIECVRSPGRLPGAAGAGRAHSEGGAAQANNGGNLATG
jgi:hypothetical protein